MRRLTFVGFLDAYVRALAGDNTRSLTRLTQACVSEPRLVEPLVLWSVMTGQADRLSPLLAERSPVQRELAALNRLHVQGDLERMLETESPRVRAEYAKVWRSYTARRDSFARDAELRLAARDRVLALEKRKNVTRYRMAKDLGLNPGNLHAFLTQGNPAKLSLQRAVQLVEYLEAA